MFWALTYLELRAYLKPCETLTIHIQNPAIGHYSGIFRTLCNTCICRNLTYSESCNIQNSSIIASRRIFRILPYYKHLWIFRTLAYLKPDTHSELSQRFTMEFFAKIVKNYNYFSIVLHITSLTRFWIRQLLNKYLLTWRVNSHYVMINIQKPVYCRKFRYIQVYLRPIQIYSVILWHI